MRRKDIRLRSSNKLLAFVTKVNVFESIYLVSLYLRGFLILVRINGIAFLIFLGYKHLWWHPILLWLGCLIATDIAASMFRGPTGLTIPALLGFVILPIIGFALWFSI